MIERRESEASSYTELDTPSSPAAAALKIFWNLDKYGVN
jgi:hypothetical protein